MRRFVLALMAVSAAGAHAQVGSRGLTARDLATLVDIKSVSIAPDKRHIAYQTYQAQIESNRYAINWHVVEIDPDTAALRSQPTRVADGGDPVFGLQGVQGGGINGALYGSPALWAPDGRQFAYTLRKNGEIQLWSSRVDTPGQRQLTNNAADVRTAAWSGDGARIYFSVGRKRSDLQAWHREQSRGGYVVLANVFASSIDMPEPPPCQDDDREANTSKLAYLDSRVCKTSVWALTLATGEEAPATTEQVAEYRLLTLADRGQRERFTQLGGERRMPTPTRDGRRLAWLENLDASVFKGLLPPHRIVATLPDGKAAVCEDSLCTSTLHERLWWSADEREVIALARTGPKNSRTTLYRWRPGAKKARLLLSTDDRFHDCQVLAAHVLCVRETWTSPGKLVSINLANGSVELLADPNPQLKNVEFTRVEQHVWKDAYGNPAIAHLVYPRDYRADTRYPMIITTYETGGFLRGAVGDEQPIHVFAQNGFFVLSFEMVEDEDIYLKEEDVSRIGLRANAYIIFRQGPQTALDAKIDDLDRKGLIDPARVGITSFSFGANLVDTALVTSKRFAAASAAWSPVSPAWAAYAPRSLKEEGEALYGGDFYGEGLKKWRETGIAFNADRVNVPFLIQVADREYFGSLQNFMALKNANKPVEMLRFPNEYHVKWQPEHRYAVYNRNIDWFNFWLRDVENSSPLDADQYARWRELREVHRRNRSAH